MKSHPFRTSSILSALVLLVASSLSVTGQQPSPRQPREQQQQEERPLIPELAAPRESGREALSVDVPRECRGIRPEVQTHDVADKFSPPGNPVTLSPALAAYLSGKPVKGYDDKRVNIIFADSFRLRNCRVCYATLELGVRHEQDLWLNDRIYVQGGPYSPNGTSFIYSPIWSQSSDPNPKTLSFALPTAALNQYLSTTNIMPSFLDVFAQDDTDFDFARLSVWYY